MKLTQTEKVMIHVGALQAILFPTNHVSADHIDASIGVANDLIAALEAENETDPHEPVTD